MQVTDDNPLPAMLLADTEPLAGLTDQIQQLREVGRLFYQRGWSVGTSSNYSIVLEREPLELLVTASGKDKGRLGSNDFVRVSAAGKPVVPGQPKESAETLLHVIPPELLGMGCVLHTHSVWATELSELFYAQGGIRLAGYEMLKGLAGVDTHEYSWWFEIFDNTQDIADLAQRVRRRMTDSRQPLRHGYLIRRHGLYTWGKDVDEARRHVEILEFLLECVGRQLMLRR